MKEGFQLISCRGETLMDVAEPGFDLREHRSILWLSGGAQQGRQLEPAEERSERFACDVGLVLIVVDTGKPADVGIVPKRFAGGSDFGIVLEPEQQAKASGCAPCVLALDAEAHEALGERGAELQLVKQVTAG